MLNLNPTTLAAVVDQAMTDAAQRPRWITALNRAVVELVSNPYLERQDGHLLIASPSGGIYAANGTCQCCAFTGIDETGKRVHAGGQPCWHRAAARLVRLHDERIAEKCPNCCASVEYANRCPAAQIHADQTARRTAAKAAADLLNECFA